jgi:pimeloyl-ACP methyl ester carboxylesterase
MKSLARPATYAGATRELALTAAHVALYPLGVSRAPPQAEPSEPPPEAPRHPALAADPATADIPVLLIHGYVHNRSAFVMLTRQLRRAGFRYVHGLNYNPLRHDIGELAEMLGEEVDRVRDTTGADRVMLVGHSMGGIVARFYTQELAAPETVDTVATLASPHRGTYATYLAPGPASRDLRPGSRLLRRLKEGARPSTTRWLAYWADLDPFVTPAVHAKIVHPALHAQNILLRNTGHLSLLMSREVVADVVDHLADRHRSWHGRWPRPGGSGAAHRAQGRLRLIHGGSRHSA